MLRHPLDLVEPAYRLHAETEKNDTERFAHFEQFADMLVELGVGAVNGLAGLAAELDLTAGLESDLRFVAAERDDVAVLLLRLPAETLDQLPQDTIDAARTEVRNRLPGVSVDADLFVFGADAPEVARFAGGLKVRFEFFVFFND